MRAAWLRTRGPLVRTARRAARLRSLDPRSRAAWREPRDSSSVVSLLWGWTCRRALKAARERAAWDWVFIRVRAALRAAALRSVFMDRMSRAAACRYVIAT